MELKELFDSLSNEVKAKVQEAKSVEELKDILEKENIELTPEQVEALSGGGQGHNECPFYEPYWACPANY